MIQSIHTCDRCGVKSEPTASKPAVWPITTHVTIEHLGDPIAVDLCDACRVVVAAAIRSALKKPASCQQELIK